MSNKRNEPAVCMRAPLNNRGRGVQTLPPPRTSIRSEQVNTLE
jgi:hypothetical protein